MTSEPPEPRRLGYELLELAERTSPPTSTPAVVVAQLGVESVVEAAFVSLLALNVPRSLETMIALLPDRSFMEKPTRLLWTDLTRDDITKPKPEWKA